MIRYSFRTSNCITAKCLLLTILTGLTPFHTFHTSAKSVAGPSGTTEYEPDSDEIFTFNDPFGDHEVTTKVPIQIKRGKSSKSRKKPLRTTTKEPDSDEAFTFFDPFGDHDTTKKVSNKQKQAKDKVDDPFYLPWQDHKELPGHSDDSKHPKHWQPEDGGFQEERGHLIPDQTTLFTLPKMTTTAMMRDERGFPVRSRQFSPSEIKRKLKEYKIIPDVIDESQSPKIPCELLYSKLEPKEKGTHAVFGTKLETAIVRYEPFYVEWPTKFEERYTLLLISPDYPTRQKPTEKEYLHWMVINIPESFVTSGQILADYVSTIPEPYTGYHRYVVLIFKQKNELRVHRLHSSGPDPSRPRFNTRKFIEQYKLGVPYAINFFESKWTNDSEFWTTMPPPPPTTTTDTPYPHHTFTWFPKVTSNESTTEEKEWFED